MTSPGRQGNYALHGVRLRNPHCPGRPRRRDPRGRLRLQRRAASIGAHRTSPIMEHMIKAVIFDLGRVIVPFDFNRGYTRLETICGIAAAEIPRRLAATGLVPRFESGEIEPRDFVRQISAHLNFDIPYEDFCVIWSSVFLPETLIQEPM